MQKQIIYSTEISKAIIDSYSTYVKQVNKKDTTVVKKNKAFLLFVNACERENKNFSSVIEELNTK